MEYTLNIGHFYPEHLNLYGDKGNILSLKKRMEWRGIKANVIEYKAEDKINFENIDIVVIGGGADREMLTVCQNLTEVKESFKQYVEDNGVVLAVCGGFEILGNYFKQNGENTDGLSLVDMYTDVAENRFIGNVVIDTEFGKVVGFENHGGRAYIKGNAPLGKVISGNGNNGEDGNEGVLYKNVFGTYLHGPVLPKNPNLADELILRALKRKYKDEELKLTPLDDSREEQAKQYIVDFCCK